ncbi:MAG: YIP1 family protein [Peptococcaceae bacterium]|nr:YIP1 family protein [Peptococcaceae bacterium]
MDDKDYRDDALQERETSGRPAGSGEKEAAEGDWQAVPGFLELIYGILFDPVKTFQRIAASPPLKNVVLIFSLVKVLSVLVGGYLAAKFMFAGLTGGVPAGLDKLFRCTAPVMAVFGLVYEYVKWFVYSGLLYFLAELSGGRGRAVGALTATGLASLPTLLALPVQILAAVLGGTGGMAWFVNILLSLAVLVWGVVLVIIGVRETQRLSTGSAVMVVLIPAVTLAVLAVIMLVLFVALAAAPLNLFFNEMNNANF